MVGADAFFDRGLEHPADCLEFRFSNLLHNAAKFTAAGGQIWLSAEKRDGAVVVSVRDTGIGLPAEQQGEIFEMFAQVEHPYGEEPGLGVGLALAKSLVELHGGRIEVHSGGAGEGAEFRVHLPIANEPADSSE